MHHIRPDAPEGNPYVEEEMYQQTRAIVNATDEQLDTHINTSRDGYDRRSPRFLTCEECGQTGYAGQYPFSTLGGGQPCDDCL